MRRLFFGLLALGASAVMLAGLPSAHADCDDDDDGGWGRGGYGYYDQWGGRGWGRQGRGWGHQQEGWGQSGYQVYGGYSPGGACCAGTYQGGYVNGGIYQSGGVYQNGGVYQSGGAVNSGVRRAPAPPPPPET